VLVCNDEGETIGMSLNVFWTSSKTGRCAVSGKPAGVLYSVIINERVTELLDIPAIKRFSTRIAATDRTCEGFQLTMAQPHQFCTFYLDKFLLASAPESAGSHRYLEMTAIPLAPDVVSGLMNLRGQIVMPLICAAAWNCESPGGYAPHERRDSLRRRRGQSPRGQDRRRGGSRR